MLHFITDILKFRGQELPLKYEVDESLTSGSASKLMSVNQSVNDPASYKYIKCYCDFNEYYGLSEVHKNAKEVY